jgi:hypothetical protein
LAAQLDYNPQDTLQVEEEKEIQTQPTPAKSMPAKVTTNSNQVQTEASSVDQEPSTISTIVQP